MRGLSKSTDEGIAATEAAGMKTLPAPGAEVFKLDCHHCKRTVQFPADSARDGIASCPLCGARLEIQWGALSEGHGQQAQPSGGAQAA
jgi:hypothetical protein